METLPENCVSVILSYTSPEEASRFSIVSPTFRSASDSDMVWQTFLPSDYEEIVSRAFIPFHFSSKKDLFRSLSHSILIDGGNKSFRLDKCCGKKSYILSARELKIRWINDPLSWSWISMPESRFEEVAVLKSVSWLEIEGKIRSGSVTPNTWYGVYMIMKVCESGYGLDYRPSSVALIMGNRVNGKAYLWHKDEKKQQMERMEEDEEQKVQVPRKREDGWMEIEVGEFFSGEDDEEVIMSVMDVGFPLKGGLILEGFEIRPKQMVGSFSNCHL